VRASPTQKSPKLNQARTWHDVFPRVFLPLGMFKTARNGNLEHVETGDQDFRKYALERSAPNGV
jgi:hypothetical protein